jgi:hypothetical protein
MKRDDEQTKQEKSLSAKDRTTTVGAHTEVRSTISRRLMYSVSTSEPIMTEPMAIAFSTVNKFTVRKPILKFQLPF